jgi:hypothetical protein
MKRIKTITLTLSLLLLLISCNKTNNSANVSVNPIGIEIKYDENPKLSLLNVVKNSVFNPKGYYLLVDKKDKYGYTKWERYSNTMIFSEDVVVELKKYQTVEDFWQSEYGTNIVNKIIDCLDRGNANQVVIIDNEKSKEINTVEETKKCLVGFEWSYPNKEKPTGVWKFSSDGTFIYSSTLIGGFKTWGNWEILSPQQINISYTGTDSGSVPDDQTLKLTSCDKLNAGDTPYWKE